MTEETCLRIIKCGVYLILFTPLIVSGSFFFSFITPKALYFMGLSEIIFAFWLILILFFPKYRPSFGKISLAVFLFIFVLTLSTFFSVDPSRSFFSNYERMAGLLMYFHLFALFLVTSSVFKKEDWIKIFSISVGVAFLVSFIFFIGKMVGEKNVRFISRNGSTLGNSSFLATYLLFNIFFAVYLLFEGKKKIIPLFGTFLFLIFLALWISTGRAGFYSSFLGLGFVALFYLALRAKSKNLRILGKIGLAFSAIAVILAIILLCYPQSFLQQEFAKLSTKARPLAWQMAISGFKERPILGWGPETFELVFDKYFHPCFFLKECGGEIWFDRAHNIVFDTLVTTGILGLLAYLLIYFFSFKELWSKYLKERQNFWVASIFSSLLIAYFVQNLTVFDSPSSLIMIFLTFSFLSAVSSQKEREKKVLPEFSPAKTFLVLIIFLFLIFSLQKFVFATMRASRSFIQAVASSNPKERLEFYQKTLQTTALGKYLLRVHLGDFVIKLTQKGEASQEEIEYLARESEKSIKESPKDLRSHIMLGKLYILETLRFNKDKISDAQKTAQRAVKISPNNQQGYWLLTEIALIKKDCEKAFAFAKKAYDLEPRVKESSLILSEIKDRCSKTKSSSEKEP